MRYLSNPFWNSLVNLLVWQEQMKWLVSQILNFPSSLPSVSQWCLTSHDISDLTMTTALLHPAGKDITESSSLPSEQNFLIQYAYMRERDQKKFTELKKI